MKIDIHTHTKKCKSGDAATRAIDAKRFCDIVHLTEVRLIAITNHNVFDLAQYKEISLGLDDAVQAWPGVELDIVANGARGHLLVIVSPEHAEQFSTIVATLTQDSNPDTFAATIDDVLKSFDTLGPLYVAHYRQKKPNIPEEALQELELRTKHPCRVLKEVTNSISAGIYISHGHASIYGSDVHDWDKYEELSRDLPELRLPVESFKHFCLLLEKDATTINTALNRKTPEDLSLDPFDENRSLNIRAYNDINVIFGPKGTGKSCILRAIANHYSSNGIDARVFTSANETLDAIYDTKGKDLTINLNNFGIKYCTDEIDAIRNSREVDITAITRYKAHFAAKTTNRNAKRIKIKDIAPEEEATSKRDFTEFNEAAEETSRFQQFVAENTPVRSVLSDEEFADLNRLTETLLERLKGTEWENFSKWKQIRLLNSAISTIRTEVARKTGEPAKPTSTGFRNYAMNRVTIVVHSAEIIRNVETQIPMERETIGSLGAIKGDLEVRTEFVFQSGDVTESQLKPVRDASKSLQKKFIRQIRKISECAFRDDLFQAVTELNALEEVETIQTVLELLQFKRYFSLNGQRYSPSSGESSMLMLQKELETDKDVYILDEPERSLGNEYISEVIVPLIKERAKAGKRVFISTHDANIAVRTLPYSSVYRCHGPGGYSTFTGNPFSNNLVNCEDPNDQLEWKKISMRTLEGGEEAFGERGKIYGHR